MFSFKCIYKVRVGLQSVPLELERDVSDSCRLRFRYLPRNAWIPRGKEGLYFSRIISAAQYMLMSLKLNYK